MAHGFEPDESQPAQRSEQECLGEVHNSVGLFNPHGPIDAIPSG